jgi:hypothetical protein
MPFDSIIKWGKKNIINPLAGVSEEGPSRAERNWDAWGYQVGADPTEKALLQKGMDMQQGLSRSYQDAVGGPVQIRLAGEGNPQQLAAARERRNAQYAAAGLPGVGFAEGRANAKIEGPSQVAGAESKGLARALDKGYGMGAGGRPGPSDKPKESLVAGNLEQPGTRTGEGPQIKTETKIPRIEKDRK